MSGVYAGTASGIVYQPSLTGFQAFAAMFEVTPDVCPLNALAWAYAYDTAIATVNPIVAGIGGPTYLQMVYNLAMDRLVNFAPDVAAGGFFAGLRSQFKLLSFVPGLVQSSGDQGTSSALLIADQLKAITLGDLQLLKTPWGRAYLALAQQTGTLWGLS